MAVKTAPRPGTQTLPPPEAAQATPPSRQPLELETVSLRWQAALDACEAALGAAARTLPSQELGRRTAALTRERVEAATALERLARVASVHPQPWLSSVRITNEMLGLPPTVSACLFDLEGVLTDSGLLHAWAWGEVLDEFLLRRSVQAGWDFVRFDRDADYRAYIEGRPRLEGIHAFLASRGIRLPEGRFDDPADAETAYGLARRKGDVLAHGLHQRRSTALPGARRYLQAAGRAGLGRCAVSASSNTSLLLDVAGLGSLVEELVDADAIRGEGLRSRPAPDLLEVGCARLGVPPEEAVTFTDTADGLAAGRTGGLLVVGVGEGEQGQRLRDFGAEQVVPSLSALLDRRLVDTR